MPILLLVLSLSLSAEEKKALNPAWMKLSVCVQNVAFEFEKLKDGVVPDPAMFEKDVKTIDQALDQLVTDGELVERKVDLLPVGDLGEEGFEFLMAAADDLSEKFGRYTAMELIDLGLKKRLMAFQEDEPFVLHLRLPAEQLNDLLKKLDEKDLLMRVNDDK